MVHHPMQQQLVLYLNTQALQQKAGQANYQTLYKHITLLNHKRSPWFVIHPVGSPSAPFHSREKGKKHDMKDSMRKRRFSNVINWLRWRNRSLRNTHPLNRSEGVPGRMPVSILLERRQQQLR